MDIPCGLLSEYMAYNHCFWKTIQDISNGQVKLDRWLRTGLLLMLLPIMLALNQDIYVCLKRFTPLSIMDGALLVQQDLER